MNVTSIRHGLAAAHAAPLDAARALPPTTSHLATPAAALTPSPTNPAVEGALRIRILTDETDSDGLGMVAALERRGVDAALWSLAHLEGTGAPGGAGLTYRGAQVAAPDLALVYHPHIGDDYFAKLDGLEAGGIAMHTPVAGMRASLDKGTTAQLLAHTGDVPRTLEVTTPEQARTAIDELFVEGTPIFLKNPVGTQGIGVAGLRNRQEATAVAELVTAMGDRRLLVQEGLQLAPGAPLHDTRHFLIDGTHVAAMDRVQLENTGELRTGLHSGGTGVPRTATDAERSMVEGAARKLGLTGVAGVDVFGGKILEANHAPGHRIANVTGVDVPGLMADSLISHATAARGR